MFGLRDSEEVEPREDLYGRQHLGCYEKESCDRSFLHTTDIDGIEVDSEVAMVEVVVYQNHGAILAHFTCYTL